MIKSQNRNQSEDGIRVGQTSQNQVEFADYIIDANGKTKDKSDEQRRRECSNEISLFSKNRILKTRTPDNEKQDVQPRKVSQDTGRRLTP